MGVQIIVQPDGRLAVFSSVVDSWVIFDATPEELVDHFASRAAATARRETRRVLEFVLKGESKTAYHQFTRTFEEADDRSFEITGKRLADYRAEPPVPIPEEALHSCEGSTPIEAHGPAITDCSEHPDGTLWSGNDEYGSQVAFCPFCGYEAVVKPR